jgi:hypothetical protein
VQTLGRGDRFPAMVVAKPGPRSRAANIDGHHGFVAAEQFGLTTFGVDVLNAKLKNPRTKTLMYLLNA